MCDVFEEMAEQHEQNQRHEEYQAANPGLTLLNPVLHGDDSGSRNLAQVHRAQWEDYKSRFAPIENQLFERFHNAETDKKEATEKAGLVMGEAMDSSFAQTDRQMQRYGINPSGRQQERRERKQALSTAANVAGAKNNMREAKDAQKMGIMAGGLSSVTQNRKES